MPRGFEDLRSKESIRDSWYQDLDSGVIMLSPDLCSDVVRVVNPKDAPKPRRENLEMSW